MLTAQNLLTLLKAGYEGDGRVLPQDITYAIKHASQTTLDGDLAQTITQIASDLRNTFSGQLKLSQLSDTLLYLTTAVDLTNENCKEKVVAYVKGSYQHDLSEAESNLLSQVFAFHQQNPALQTSLVELLLAGVRARAHLTPERTHAAMFETAEELTLDLDSVEMQHLIRELSTLVQLIRSGFNHVAVEKVLPLFELLTKTTNTDPSALTTQLTMAARASGLVETPSRMPFVSTFKTLFGTEGKIELKPMEALPLLELHSTIRPALSKAFFEAMMHYTFSEAAKTELDHKKEIAALGAQFGLRITPTMQEHFIAFKQLVRDVTAELKELPASEINKITKDYIELLKGSRGSPEGAMTFNAMLTSSLYWALPANWTGNILGFSFLSEILNKVGGKRLTSLNALATFTMPLFGIKTPSSYVVEPVSTFISSSIQENPWTAFAVIAPMMWLYFSRNNIKDKWYEAEYNTVYATESDLPELLFTASYMPSRSYEDARKRSIVLQRQDGTVLASPLSSATSSSNPSLAITEPTASSSSLVITEPTSSSFSLGVPQTTERNVVSESNDYPKYYSKPWQ